LQNIYKLTLEHLLSGIPNLILTSIKNDEDNLLHSEIYDDTYLDKAAIDKWNILIIIYNLFETIRYFLLINIINSLLSVNHKDLPKIMLFGYGEYLLNYIVRDVPAQKIKTSEISNRYISIYASSLGPILDYIKVNSNGLMDLTKIRIYADNKL